MELSKINYFGQYEYVNLKNLKDRNLKLSFCITCMNRLWQIKETLPINLRNNFNQHQQIEFIVVDLGTPGLSEWIEKHCKKYYEIKNLYSIIRSYIFNIIRLFVRVLILFYIIF